ncbi:MAG: 8-oxoguanine deaminase [Rhodospirillales bacterium]|nr:8-oxoguanine deaminase [Rhodospirillales bacterium]
MTAGPLWIRDPLAILADDAARGVVVQDGRIVELVPAGGAPATPDVAAFDAGAHVVIPGLINTHHHFYQTLTRAAPAALDRALFGWLDALYPIWARLTPAALDSAVTVAMAELLLSGCTTTTDHHYVFPAGLEGAIDIEVAVARRLGLRAVFTRGSMNLSQRDGGLPPDAVVQDEDAILADSARLIDAHHDPRPHAQIQIALAPCSPFSVTRSLMRSTAELAARRGVRLHTHLAETEDETAFCLARFNCRPLDYLEDVGWLHDRVWLAHGVHFDAAEIARLARAGVGVTHCPCSNQMLGSGHCPVCDMEAAGLRVGLGVDGSASNNASNLMQEVRAAFLLQRHRYGVARVSHRDALRWATEGSAACIGRPELGRIAPGAAADLALFRLDRDLRFAGAQDPLAALVLCGADRADCVMVGGRWVVQDGAIPGLDIPALIARQARQAATLLADRGASSILPHH